MGLSDHSHSCRFQSLSHYTHLLAALLTVSILLMNTASAQTITSAVQPSPVILSPTLTDDIVDFFTVSATDSTEITSIPPSPLMIPPTFSSVVPTSSAISTPILSSFISDLTSTMTPSPSPLVSISPPPSSPSPSSSTPDFVGMTMSPSPTPTDVTSQVTTPTTQTSDSTTPPVIITPVLSMGAIIGIAAAGGGLLLIILLLFFCLCCYCCCCRSTQGTEYVTGNDGRPFVVVRKFNQGVDRSGSIISGGSRGSRTSFARSSISSIASSIRRFSYKRRSKNKDGATQYVNEEAIAMKVTPL